MQTEIIRAAIFGFMVGMLFAAGLFNWMFWRAERRLDAERWTRFMKRRIQGR